MKAIIISQWDWCACERVRLFLQFTCSTTLGYASQINSSKSKVEINTHRILNGRIIAASWVSFTPIGNVLHLLTIIICKNLSFLWRTNSCWTTTSQSVRLKSRISKLISCEIAFMRFTYLFKWSWASTILLARLLREERSKQYFFEYIFANRAHKFTRHFWRFIFILLAILLFSRGIFYLSRIKVFRSDSQN